MKVILYGTVFKRGDEPAVKLSYTAENKAVAKFTVCESRKFGKTEQNKLDFWDFTVFGKQAEFLGKYFDAGKPISIFGDAYHSKDNQGKVYLNLVAGEVEFLPKEYGEFEAQVQTPETKMVNQTQYQHSQQTEQGVGKQTVQQTNQQAQPQQSQQRNVSSNASSFAPPAGFNPFG